VISGFGGERGAEAVRRRLRYIARVFRVSSDESRDAARVRDVLLKLRAISD